MARKTWVRRLGNVVRYDAPTYFLVSVISFAVSVAAVRLFLNLTGFPKIGSGPVHISHVLWGGLLLFVAALLVLVVDYSKVYIASAILTGAGMGLFIDEVGKFITSDYNYFVPVAAPIVYAFFLVTLLVYQRIRRLPGRGMVRQLNQALELIQQDLVSPLTLKEEHRLKSQLSEVAKGSPAERRTQLAKLLLDFVQGEQLPPLRRNFWQRFEARVEHWLREGRLRSLLVLGLVGMGLWALKSAVEFQPWLPPDIQSVLQSLRLGAPTPHDTTFFLFQLQLGLEAACSLGYLASALLLGLRRASKGLALGYLTQLLSLCVLDLLVFYYEQFSSIILVALQFLLLLGLIYYQRHFQKYQEPVRRWTRGLLTRVEKGAR